MNSNCQYFDFLDTKEHNFTMVKVPKYIVILG